MTKPYDKNDNDTYVEKFSNNPVQDVEVHMFRDPKGSVSGPCGQSGHYSVQSAIKAENNVLHFPKAKDVDANNFSLIKYKKIATFYPLSLVMRYEMEENSLIGHYKTPIFFDAKKEKFIVLMDYRFARDLDMSELGRIEGLLQYNDKKDPSIKYIGIAYNQISDIEKANATFTALSEAYTNYKMTMQQGQKVIVVSTKSADDKKLELLKSSSLSLQEALGQAIFSTNFTFEYAVAVRFKNRYYLLDNEGNIMRSKSFFINKEEKQKYHNGLAVKQVFRGEGLFDNEKGTVQLFVTAYSDEQFEIIKRLKDRIHQIHQEIAVLFSSSSSNSNALDESILSLPDNSTIKKLTNHG